LDITRRKEYLILFKFGKKKTNTRVIKTLKDENEDLILDDDGILNSMCKFYENLYRTSNITPTDINEYLNNIDVEFILKEKEKIN
jgi:hypothetical protein